MKQNTNTKQGKYWGTKLKISPEKVMDALEELRKDGCKWVRDVELNIFSKYQYKEEVNPIYLCINDEGQIFNIREAIYEDPKGIMISGTKDQYITRQMEVFSIFKQEKEEDMKKGKFRKIKVRVDEHSSKLVQEALFEDGAKWRLGKEPKYLNSKFLFVNGDGIISAEPEDEDYFNRHANREVKEVDIIEPNYEVKLAWAKGEVVQFKGLDGWKTWGDTEILDLTMSEQWQVKPKTTTVQQWERRYLFDNVVHTMGSLDSNDSLFKSKDVNWISDVYSKTYANVPTLNGK